MSATMKPIPEEGGVLIDCPLPFVGAARLAHAHNAVAAAYQAARSACAPGRSWAAAWPEVQRAALSALDSCMRPARGRTSLEVVAYYALLREKIPTEEQAREDAEAAARLAVWLAVWAG